MSGIKRLHQNVVQVALQRREFVLRHVHRVRSIADNLRERAVLAPASFGVLRQALSDDLRADHAARRLHLARM